MSPQTRRPAAPARAAIRSLAQDLTVIDRIEGVLRATAADRTQARNAPAMRRLADWIAGLR